MVALLSNTLRQYVSDYNENKSEKSLEEVKDVLELYYLNKGLSKYEYEKLLSLLDEDSE